MWRGLRHPWREIIRIRINHKESGQHHPFLLFPALVQRGMAGSMMGAGADAATRRKRPPEGLVIDAASPRCDAGGGSGRGLLRCGAMGCVTPKKQRLLFLL